MGACDAWMAKYHELKQKQEMNLRSTTPLTPTPSTTMPTSNTPISTRTKMPKYFHDLPIRLRHKSDKEIYKRYCRYLLGACDVWMAKYHEFKRKQEMMEKTTTTTSPPILTYEKIYIRIDG